MKYYAVSDIHGLYSKFYNAPTASGYFDDTQPCKLNVLGDLFVDLVTVDAGVASKHHKHNGTYDTALQLTGIP